MHILKFFDYIKSFGLSPKPGLLDLGDRVTFKFTTVILVMCMVVLGAREYFAKSIACMVLNKPFTMSMMDELMIENYCWVSGVLPFRASQALPLVSSKDHDDSKYGKFINYYLWVPLLFGLQAVLAYLPKMAFDLLTFNRLAANFFGLTSAAAKAVVSSRADRAAIARSTAEFLMDLLDAARDYRRRCRRRDGEADSCGCCSAFLGRLRGCLGCCAVGKRVGNCTFVLYMATKMVGTAGLLLQLELMRQFLGFKSLGFGAQLLRNITMGLDWEATQVLPRVGVCRFRYNDRAAQNSVHPYCTISGNVFIEKIYIVLWFYFVAATALNSACLLLWLWRFALPCNRHAYVKTLLSGKFEPEELDLRMVRFESELLRSDGLFYAWMLHLNCGQIMTSAILQNLYEDYLLRIREPRANADRGETDDQAIYDRPDVGRSGGSRVKGNRQESSDPAAAMAYIDVETSEK